MDVHIIYNSRTQNYLQIKLYQKLIVIEHYSNLLYWMIRDEIAIAFPYYAKKKKLPVTAKLYGKLAKKKINRR